MTAVEDGHVIGARYRIDGSEEGVEVGLGVDVFLAVGREKDVASFLKSQA